MEDFIMNMKVKQTLDCIIQRFKVGDIPKAVAFSMFPVAGIPSAKWSKLNRTIMFISGTQDARGFKQWKEIGRTIKKDSQALYILVPNFRKIVDEETGVEKRILIGFLARPVFKMEDTDGTPLDYQQIELPKLPLVDCAEKWGVSVKAVPGNYSYYGYYSSKRKEIGLATSDEVNFFHELAHCGHEKIVGSLAPGQDPFQEIVAELSAQALCCLVGKNTKVTIGSSYKYIERYAEKLNMSAHSACLRVLRETEQVLMMILKTSQQEN
jgi:hypothetical protein